MKNDVMLKIGNLVKISQKVREGEKERAVSFTGRIVGLRGKEENQMLTVRQVLDGVAVDRIFPVASPTISDISRVKESESNYKKAKRLGQFHKGL